MSSCSAFGENAFYVGRARCALGLKLARIANSREPLNSASRAGAPTAKLRMRRETKGIVKNPKLLVQTAPNEPIPSEAKKVH